MPSSAKKPPGESIEQLLSDVCRHHHGQMRALFHSLELHRGQPRLLSRLWETEGLTHTELAIALDIQPATITKMVQRMERAGFVQRRSDKDDERISRVYLTDKGREIESQVKTLLDESGRRAVRGFSREERETLARLLSRTRDNLLKTVQPGKEEERS